MDQRDSGRTRLRLVERVPAEYEAACLAAIVDLTRRLEAAWNAGDGRAYADAFTADSDYIAFDGTHLRGRDANARHHQKLFDSVLKGTRLVFEGKPSARFVAPDVAIVHTMGAVLMPWQRTLTPRRRSNQTLVAVRAAEGWRFAAFHNTRYRPTPIPRGFTLALILAVLRLRRALARKRPRRAPPAPPSREQRRR